MKIFQKVRHYYELMGDLSHTNLVLKICLTVVGVCLLVSLLVIVRLARRPPLIITILPSGKAVATSYKEDAKTATTEEEIKQFIEEFISVKYNWNPQNVETQWNRALKFLSYELQKQIQEKTQEELAYVKKTGLSQHIYIKEIIPNDPSPFDGEKGYVVLSDRIIGIKDSRFTTDFKLLLTIKKQRRTSADLHGLKITKIAEILPDKSSK